MKRTTPPPQKPATTSSEQDNTGPKKLEKKIQRWNPDRAVVDTETIRISKVQAARLFKVLNAGHSVHRRNCDEHGFTFNGSVHSVVAKLEEVYDTPVERRRIQVETSQGPVKLSLYWFTGAVRKALADPKERAALAEETRLAREGGNIAAGIKRLRILATMLVTYPKLQARHPALMGQLRALASEILDTVEVKHDRTH